jgi:hypothetical protein
MICHPFEAASHNVHFQLPDAVAALIDRILGPPTPAAVKPLENTQ